MRLCGSLHGLRAKQRRNQEKRNERKQNVSKATRNALLYRVKSAWLQRKVRRECSATTCNDRAERCHECERVTSKVSKHEQRELIQCMSIKLIVNWIISYFDKFALPRFAQSQRWHYVTARILFYKIRYLIDTFTKIVQYCIICSLRLL